jgi:acetylornithine deacetylase
MPRSRVWRDPPHNKSASMQSSDLLARLISFPTVSRNGSRPLIDFASTLLRDCGADVQILPVSPNKDNLFATLGPRGPGGIVLSGHTDVVPVDGQTWTSDPFVAREQDGKIYGRGAADMKGFLACALAMCTRARHTTLSVPVHLCLSCDEEIGCVGVRPMLDHLKRHDFRPRFCIVGEPTSMQIGVGHKGKLAARAVCHGEAAHSSVAPRAVNAIHLAADFISALRRVQADIAANGARDDAYDIPYTTLHAGVIRGGHALNIVADECSVDFEIRHLADDHPTQLLSRIEAAASTIVAAHSPKARISLEVLNAYPALSAPRESGILEWIGGLIGASSTTKVSFGTEAGLFVEALGVPTVVCGPGSMDQGHKPDEFIARADLDACDALLDRLLDSVSS